MKLFQFNKEFDEKGNEYMSKPSTYVVAEDMEKAIVTYRKGPHNNEQIWSVTSLGHPTLVQELTND